MVDISNNVIQALSNKIKELIHNKSDRNHEHGNINTDGIIVQDNSVQPNKNVVTNNDGQIVTEDKQHIPTKTSDLINDGDGDHVFITNDDLSTKTLTLNKLISPTTGYIATYELLQNGVSLGKIDIPKDYLVKSASLQTCSSDNQPIDGYNVGDKYLDFIVNTTDNDESDQHVYINVKDLVDIYSVATDSSEGLMSVNDKIKLDNIANNANNYSHPNSGVTAGTNYDGNQTPNFGGTFNIPKLTYNAQGHITGSSTSTVTIPNLPATMAPSSHTHTKSQITDFPTSMTPTSHTHGNLQNNGQVGSTAQASKNVVTDANGKITTENKPTIPTKTSQLTNDGDGTNVFVKNNDSRLSNSRNPLFNAISASSSATKNLNDYKTGGFYYINNDNNSPYVTNCPLSGTANKSFFLLVETWGTSSTYVKQTLTYYPTNDTYTRTCKPTDNWTAWRKLSEVSFTQTKTSGIEIGTITINGVATKLYQQDNNTTYSVATTSANGLMSSSDKTKLDGVATSANNYSHPNSGVTAGSNYNSNQTPSFGGTFNIPKLTFNAQGHITASASSTVTVPSTAATTSAAGLMSSSDKTKLDGIATGANKYSHPNSGVTAGTNYNSNQTPGFGGTFNIPKLTYDAQGHITASASSTVTIPSAAATTSAGGLMSSTDKTKLDGIATGANKYSHPSSGITAGTNYSSNQTPSFGATFNIPKLTYDAQGHITASGYSTVKIPALPTTMTPSSHTHTKSQITDFPTSMTPTSHTHGNITNAGAIGSTANKPVITTTNGVLTTGSFGTSSGTFCEGNDTRISNATSNTVIMSFRGGSSIQSAIIDPSGVTVVKGNSIYIGCTDANGTAKTGGNVFIIVQTPNGGNHIGPKTVSNGIASATINYDAGTYYIIASYFYSNQSLGSMVAKLTVKNS